MSKPSHYTTPRMMRDGTWTSGNVSAYERQHKLCDWLLACIAVCVVVAISIGALR